MRDNIYYILYIDRNDSKHGKGMKKGDRVTNEQLKVGDVFIMKFGFSYKRFLVVVKTPFFILVYPYIHTTIDFERLTLADDRDKFFMKNIGFFGRLIRGIRKR